MDRRAFLGALAALTGCVETSGRSDESATPSTTATAHGSESDDRDERGEPTVRSPTSTPDGVYPDTRLEPREWYESGDVAIAVDAIGERTSIDVGSPLDLDDTERHDLPDGQRLLYAQIRVKNVAPDALDGHNVGFSILDLKRGETFDTSDEVDVRGRDEPIPLSRVVIDDRERYSTVSFGPLESGEVVERWVGTVVSGDGPALDHVGVGYGERYHEHGVAFAAGWGGF